jgi:hypothetical protein
MKGSGVLTKAILSLALFSLLLFTFQNTAHSKLTKWEDAGLSLSELLDSGWQLMGHGTNRVAANSNSGNGFDVQTFSFLLTKNGKHIICILADPGQPSTEAKCRRLN